MLNTLRRLETEMATPPTKYQKAYYVSPTYEDFHQATVIKKNGGNMDAVDVAFSRLWERYGATSQAITKNWGPTSIFIRGEGGMWHEYGVFRPQTTD